jgi:hypothetical protein
MSGKTQFEGRTAEEAVARARAALGNSGALRCWKTRKGGVGGFFAKEVFVASLTPPPGSERMSGRGSRASSRKASDGRGRRRVSDGSARSLETGAPPPSLVGELGDPEDHLSGLVEATADQVSLQSLAIPADAFDQVLAEAQAALARQPEELQTEGPDPQRVSPEDDEVEVEPPRQGSAPAPGAAPPSDRQEPGPPRIPGGVAPTTAKVKAKARPKPKARPKSPAARSVATVAPPQPSRTPRLPDLKPGLRSMGVPDQYLPPGRRPSLDLLADVMGTLPVPGALPTRQGAVVAVVGAGDNLARTVDLLTSELSLGQRDVLPFAPGPGAASERTSDLAAVVSPSLGRQIARRRANGRRSVVAVHAAPGRSLPQETRACLDQVAPDYVLAAVGACCKRADVEHWIGELPTVDALALWELSATRTPAELLGVLPIAFVDGEAGSSLGWTLFLAGRAVGWRQ